MHPREESVCEHPLYDQCRALENLPYVSLYRRMEINTYDLMANANVGVTMSSQSGLEMATMARPVVILGKAFYRNKGFTWDYEPSQSLEELLQQAITDKTLSSRQQVCMERFGHDLWINICILLILSKVVIWKRPLIDLSLTFKREHNKQEIPLNPGPGYLSFESKVMDEKLWYIESSSEETLPESVLGLIDFYVPDDVLGRCLLREGHYEQAWQSFQSWLAKVPNLKAFEASLHVQDLKNKFYIGSCALKVCDAHAAQYTFGSCGSKCAMLPWDIQVATTFHLGCIYQKKSEIQQAMAYFNMTIALNPTHQKAREQLLLLEGCSNSRASKSLVQLHFSYFR